MDKKTTGIVATVATSLLCGCPGLASLCWGLIMSFVGLVPNSEIDIMGSSDPSAAIMTGLGALCLGLLLVAIPVVVGFVTLRKKPAATVTDMGEPLPPTS